MKRWILFGVLIVLAVVSDYVTKRIAENNLASVTSRWDHPVVRTVEAPDGEIRVDDWVDAEFGEGTAEADPPMVARIQRVGEDGEPLGGSLAGSATLEDGATVRVGYRAVTIVPGFWDHIYVQNYGAAWGFLSDGNEKFVRPFFLVVSVIAVFIVLSIFRNAREDQHVMTVALALIVGGAVGNFIDRVQLGYVVDFIDWYVTVGGDEKHWPTFNVADVWITVGVALLMLQILFEKPEEESEPVATGDPQAVAG